MESQESNGKVFQFFDGEKTRYGDPVEIQYDLYLNLLTPDETLDDCDLDVPQAQEGQPPPDPVEVAAAMHRKFNARKLVMAAVREAFGMVPFDQATGKGATFEHCRTALDVLWECLAKKKPNTDGSVTSSPPTTVTPASSANPSASA